MKKQEFVISIQPAIPIEDRHKIEKFLETIGYTVTGGGGWLDESECNIEFEKEIKK
jgi:hypothetical protein